MIQVWRFLVANKSIMFLVLIILLALKVFIPQIDNLKDSLSALKDANTTWILAGVVVFFAGLPILAWQFLELALKPLNFLLTLRVEMAGLFVSKLLPSSLGTFSLNLYYLVQQKHTVVQGSTVMAMNAATSGIAYGILIILALVFNDTSFGTISINYSSWPLGLIGLIGLGLIALCTVLYRMPKINVKVKKMYKDIVGNLKSYKNNPRAAIMGTLLNGIGSFTSLFALYASAHAIGVDLSLSSALLAYTFGNIACAIVPTPGGLGAAEAGIYSGLVLVGIDSADAITITLLYRLISYWLPILPGYYFFWSLRKTVLKKFSIKSRELSAN